MSEENAAGAAPYAAAPEKPAVAIVDEPPQMSSLGRLLNVYFAPGEVFADVRRSPRGWWLPVVAMVVIAIISSLVIKQRLDLSPERMAQAGVELQLEREGKTEKDLSPQQREQMETGKKVAVAILRFQEVLTVVFIPIMLLVMAGVYRLLLLIFQAETTFLRVLAATSYAYVAPNIVKALLMIVLAFLRSPGELDMKELVEGRGLLTTSLAFLVSAKEHPVLAVFLSNLDLFSIWWLVLAIIGMAAVCRRGKTGVAAIVVLAPYVLLVLVSIGWTALTAR